MVTVRRGNAIMYTDRWSETVAFYREVLSFAVEFENDWFIEFAAGPGVFLSLADAGRTSIAPGRGDGIVLSLQVDDVHALRSDLLNHGVEVAAVGIRWGADVLDVRDPAGTRVEFWSEHPDLRLTGQ